MNKRTQRRLNATAAVALALLATLLGAAAPANATSNGLELSNDGITFASSLPAPLFGSMPALVPSETATATFVARNSSAVPAYLSVALSSRGWDSWDYASTLTVGAASAGSTSSNVGLTSTSGCTVLLHGRLLNPGETAVVTTSITLGNLNGTSGQQASAWMSLDVKLTEAVTGTSPRTCSGGGSSVVVVDDPTEPTPEPTATPTSSPTPTGDPGDNTGGLPPFANTAAGFDGRFVAALALAIPLGSLFYLLLSRLRRRRERRTAQAGLSS